MRPNSRAVKSFGVDASALTPLEPFAADGRAEAHGAGAGTCRRSRRRFARTSGAAPSEGSFLGRLEANAQKLVRVTPVDAPRGDDPAR